MVENVFDQPAKKNIRTYENTATKLLQVKEMTKKLASYLVILI